MYGFELIASILVGTTAAAICYIAYSVPLSLAPHFWAGAGAFPFILGAILLLLSLFWMLDSAKGRAREKEQADAEQSVTSSLEKIIGPKDRQKCLLLIAVSTIIFVFIIIPVFGMISRDYGFVGATFLFVFASLKMFSHLSSGKLALVAAATAASVYFIFTYGLLLPIPR